MVRGADSHAWGVIGGSVEIDERPEDAAIREVEEETGLRVAVTGPVAALGGPKFRVRYLNGDETSYVSVVYEGRVITGTEHPDGRETIQVGWFAPDDLHRLDLEGFTRAAFEELGWLATEGRGGEHEEDDRRHRVED
ncbi:MAG: NUDIX domain-containing protein [Candidatus Dormibacteraeota bacterium]|nr:NUDIX domain-containing protein [Candidatus Dormibacteraeota bacterium]